MTMLNWWHKRKKPYTEIGVRRLPCSKCGEPGFSQWSICADQSNYRVLCLKCDIALNKLVLNWIGHPSADILINHYTLLQKAKNAFRKIG